MIEIHFKASASFHQQQLNMTETDNYNTSHFDSFYLCKQGISN